MKRPLFIFLASVFLMTVAPIAQARDNGYNRPNGNHDGNCRAYSRQIIHNGRWETAYGTACLYRDGVWRIVSENTRRPAVEPAPYYVRDHYPAYYPNRHNGQAVHKRDQRNDRYGRNDFLYRGPDRHR